MVEERNRTVTGRLGDERQIVLLMAAKENFGCLNLCISDGARYD